MASMEAFRRRYMMAGRGMPAPPGGDPAAAAPPAAPPDAAAPAGVPGSRKTKTADTNEISTLTLTFRAVSLKGTSGQADADKGIAYAVLQELQNSPKYFSSDPQETKTTSEVINDEQTGTFTFSITAKLAHPLKL
ncbi:MAG: hypothetical protein NT154_45250 [Verrucomicrobia bacterium]|nr:hypothetical protein [Verrucomicrobiota bacterium]